MITLKQFDVSKWVDACIKQRLFTNKNALWGALEFAVISVVNELFFSPTGSAGLHVVDDRQTALEFWRKNQQQIKNKCSLLAVYYIPSGLLPQITFLSWYWENSAIHWWQAKRYSHLTRYSHPKQGSCSLLCCQYFWILSWANMSWIVLSRTWPSSWSGSNGQG